MLRALATLLVFQVAGEIVRLALGLPVPGPVIGMLAFLAWLALKPREVAALREPVLTLLSHLSLLFVPAGVGVMLHLRRLADEALAVGVALVASTALSIVATAVVVERTRRWLDRRQARREDADGGRG